MTKAAHGISDIVMIISPFKCINTLEKVLKMRPSVAGDGSHLVAHLGGFVSHAGYTGGVGGITGPVA